MMLCPISSTLRPLISRCLGVYAAGDMEALRASDGTNMDVSRTRSRSAVITNDQLSISRCNTGADLRSREYPALTHRDGSCDLPCLCMGLLWRCARSAVTPASLIPAAASQLPARQGVKWNTRSLPWAGCVWPHCSPRFVEVRCSSF